MSVRDTLELVLQSGAATRTWGIRGEGFKGTGKRSKAKFWKNGASGKQNRSVNQLTEDAEDLVAVFSDSQLRPLVQGDVPVPTNWYVNSTPGGCFSHVKEEILAAKIPESKTPSWVVLLVGTNDLSKHVVMDRARGDFHGLLLAVKKRFPLSKVVALSILPRLDEFWIREAKYKEVMDQECQKLGVHFFDVTPNFEVSDPRLWSWKDGLHISEDKGIPLLLCLLQKEMNSLQAAVQDSSPSPPPQPAPEPQCPAWLWRELRHHRSEGRQGRCLQAPPTAIGSPPAVKKRRNTTSKRRVAKRYIEVPTMKKINWSQVTSRGIVMDNFLLTNTNPGLYLTAPSQYTKCAQNSKISKRRRKVQQQRAKAEVHQHKRRKIMQDATDPIDLLISIEQKMAKKASPNSALKGKLGISTVPLKHFQRSYAKVVQGERIPKPRKRESEPVQVTISNASDESRQVERESEPVQVTISNASDENRQVERESEPVQVKISNASDEKHDRNGLVNVIVKVVCGGGRVKKNSNRTDVKLLAEAVCQSCKVTSDGKPYDFDWAAIFKKYYGRSRANHPNALKKFRSMYYRNKSTIDKVINEILFIENNSPGPNNNESFVSFDAKTISENNDKIETFYDDSVCGQVSEQNTLVNFDNKWGEKKASDANISFTKSAIISSTPSKRVSEAPSFGSEKFEGRKHSKNTNVAKLEKEKIPPKKSNSLIIEKAKTIKVLKERKVPVDFTGDLEHKENCIAGLSME
eukprot:gene11088-19951_t